MKKGDIIMLVSKLVKNVPNSKYMQTKDMRTVDDGGDVSALKEAAAATQRDHLTRELPTCSVVWSKSLNKVVTVPKRTEEYEGGDCKSKDGEPDYYGTIARQKEKRGIKYKTFFIRPSPEGGFELIPSYGDYRMGNGITYPSVEAAKAALDRGEDCKSKDANSSEIAAARKRGWTSAKGGAHGGMNPYLNDPDLKAAWQEGWEQYGIDYFNTPRRDNIRPRIVTTKYRP